MTLKMKLVSAIMAFAMVLGIFVVAVLAANNASVNMSGSLSFTADDVVAHVTGSVSGAQETPSNLDVTYSSKATQGDEMVWEDLNLNFIDHKTPIVFSFTVENLSIERTMTLTFTDNVQSNTNINKEVKRDNADYTSGTKVTLDAKADGITTNKTSFTVSFSVADGDTSFTGVGFDYMLNLYDESAVPFDFTGFNIETSDIDKSGTITSYTGTETNLVLPSTYSIQDGKVVAGGDYTITAIGGGVFDAEQGITEPGAFAENETLQSVVLPDTLTSIGDMTFVGCPNLASVTIPDGVKEIGDMAFGGCGLTSVTIPGSVKEIGAAAFMGCQSLTEVTLPEGLERLDGMAFAMTQISELHIPASVSYIGFFNPGIISIDADLPPFSFTSLLTITVSEDNPVYHSGNSNAIIETATKTLVLGCAGTVLPTDGSVTKIGDCAFINGHELAQITIPDCVTSIGDGAFYTVQLTSIDIPDSVTSIGNGVFYQCGRLASVTIGSGVISIGDEAFRDCSRLTSIDIPDSVTSIGDEAFRGCNRLTSVTLGNGLKIIGDSAFYTCGLTSIGIPDSVTSIGSNAFAYNNFTSIIIPDSVTSIGNNAFFFCNKLRSVTIDSPDVAAMLASQTAAGGLINYAETVYIKADIASSLTEWFTTHFTQGETADGYAVYTKN